MESFIARENIKRFSYQLRNCGDPAMRLTLESLLAAEKVRLNEFQRGSVAAIEISARHAANGGRARSCEK